MIYNLVIKLLMVSFPRLKLDKFLLPKEKKSKFVSYLLEAIVLVPALIFIPLFQNRFVSNFRYSPRKNNKPLMFFDVTDLYYFNIKRCGTRRVITSVYVHLLKMLHGFELTPIVYHFSASKNLFSVVDLPSMKIIKTIPQPKKRDIYINLGMTIKYLPFIRLKLFNQLFPKGSVRCVFMIHDLIPIEEPQVVPFLFPTFFRLWISACLQQADLILSVSKTTHGKLISYINQQAIPTSAQFDWVLLGSDLQKIKKPSNVKTNALSDNTGRAKSLQFLHVSNIVPRKGHKQLIEAFDILWKKHDAVKLILVGGGNTWNNKKLLHQIMTHEFYGTKLLWVTDISDQDLKTIYQQSSALIHPSESEGFGLSIVEAQNLHKPVICRDIPIFREIAIGDGVTFFNTKSPTDLARVIDHWIESEVVSKSLKNEVRDWHKSTQKLLNLLETHLNTPQNQPSNQRPDL